MTAEPFTYKGKTYIPRPLRISPLIAREHGCPPGCAACCPKFSLDYLPFEERPEGLHPRTVYKDKIVYSDMQTPGWHCKHVNDVTGRCTIHGKQPFSCDFEAVRFHLTVLEGKNNRIDVSPFGRAWALKRIDGERGAWCTFSESNESGAKDSYRKISRLKEWMEYFEMPHKIDPILNYIEQGVWKNNMPLILPA